MNVKKIVAATDFSEASVFAVETALSPPPSIQVTVSYYLILLILGLVHFFMTFI